MKITKESKIDMSNRRNIRHVRPRQIIISYLEPTDVPADSPLGCVLRASVLCRRAPTAEERAWLTDRGYDAITPPVPIVVVETTDGPRLENLHRAGWPDACDCGTPICTGDAVHQ